MEDDNDMETPPNNVPLLNTPADDTLFEEQIWGWYGIYRCAVVAQNQNNSSFKNGWIPKILSYIDIFLHCLITKWFRIVVFTSTSRSMKEADVSLLTYGYLLLYLGVWILIST